MKFFYKCTKCKTIKKDDVTIKYQILLYNITKNDLFITKMAEFKLLPPNRLYQELLYHLTTKKDWTINIDSIFTEKQINMINFIYQFNAQELSFDFLIPFKKISNENIELIQNNLGTIINNINKRRFTFLENKAFENISQSLIKNIDKEDFIPIDISNNYDNEKRYNDLVPCFINYYYDFYDLNETEGDEKENNNDNNIFNDKNDEEQSFFTINSIKK
jgi:hypothetical protein